MQINPTESETAMATLDWGALEEALERNRRLAPIQRRWELAYKGTERWNVIREAWAECMPFIEKGEYLEPYFLDWAPSFTPIEYMAWMTIRGTSIHLYPQCPVGGVFVDFGDPHLRIGVELDGAAFHERKRDTQRDQRLAHLGWKIFRITGKQAAARLAQPLDADFAGGAERYSSQWYQALEKWAYGCSEGVLWAVKTVYYAHRKPTSNERAIAKGCLEDHSLVRWCLDDEHTGYDS